MQTMNCLSAQHEHYFVFQDGTYGGRLKKKKRSSWRRERKSASEHYYRDLPSGNPSAERRVIKLKKALKIAKTTNL